LYLFWIKKEKKFNKSNFELKKSSYFIKYSELLACEVDYRLEETLGCNIFAIHSLIYIATFYINLPSRLLIDLFFFIKLKSLKDLKIQSIKFYNFAKNGFKNKDLNRDKNVFFITRFLSFICIPLDWWIYISYYLRTGRFLRCF